MPGAKEVSNGKGQTRTKQHKKTSNTKVLKVVVASTGLNNLLRIN